MNNRKKVIKGIECSLNHHTEICEECPYYDLFKQEKHCGRQLKLDTLALLQSQPEVVLCADCTYKDKDGWNRMICVRIPHQHFVVDEKFFCADGKQKGGDSDA